MEDEQLRIAMVDPSLFSPEYDATLCDGLGEVGHEVFLIARWPRRGEPLRPGRFTLVPHFYRRSERLRSRRPRGARYAKALEHQIDLARLPRVLRRLAPDVVHFQWPVLPVADRLALAVIAKTWPTVLTVHNTTPFHGSPHSRAQNLGTARFVRAFDRLVAHGRFSAEALEASQPRPVDVVPHGLLADPEPPGSARAAPPASPDGTIRLLCFGRVRTYKGIDVLIDALARLAPGTRARLEVVVAGVPEQPIEPLEKAARDLGVDDRIRWDLRFVPDDEVGRLFRAADAVVLPYREVDASGVLMKAIASETPVVATRVGAFADLLADDDAGLLVEPGDPADLAAALARLVEEPGRLAAMTEAAASLRRRQPPWSEIAARTADVYRRAMDRRVRPRARPAGLA